MALKEPVQVTGHVPKGSSKGHPAQLDLEGCQQLFATCAAWQCGESFPAQRLFKSGSKPEYLGAVNLPGVGFALAPPMLPVGSETPRVQPGKTSADSGAPVQAGTSKRGNSHGNLSLHEMNPNRAQTRVWQVLEAG